MDKPCRNWPGPFHSNGYGRVWIYETHERYAHRQAYIETYGEIPAGMDVCHMCDNKICVEPTHLELGTRSKNVHDEWDRGLASRGQDHSANLRDADIYEIRQRYSEGELQKDLADEFDLSQQQISRIVRRKRWTHLP